MVEWIDKDCCTCSKALASMYAAEAREDAKVARTKQMYVSQSTSPHGQISVMVARDTLKNLKGKIQEMEDAVAAKGGSERESHEERFATSTKYYDDAHLYKGMDFVERSMAMAEEMRKEKARRLSE